ncbi:NAD(P)/FAD-dependent oxidoreductase [Novosphingobium sp. KCTC 2891]|uniref:flavin-containing monooxygenase n=1 Tax=Novosphingobium sp. KCTC 2891 TaxID=2989730 RepID=UPI0022221154|nr:NAD(P)/FAD-dependent oxidoreductase [Novosphingobium sp. KCTC 2891]MCW1385029.1 NAD(P)/FAD-dependent oxidoreductase [Novosphingobium sp. KCTC 2891]
MATLAEPTVTGLDEEMVRRALDMANLNALRIALYQATGDEELARMNVVREPYWGGAFEMVVLAPEHAQAVREKALAFLRSGAASRAEEPEGAPDEPTLRKMMELFSGEEPNDYIFNFGREELNFDAFPRGVEWNRDIPADVKAGFHVIVVGAGVSGLVTAIQLDRLGLPYTIIERNDDVGGTWLTNTYPDARVDIPSYHYQLTVTKNYPWKHYFATQPELLEYIRHVADSYNLRGKIRFGTELTEAHWDEDAKLWRTTLRCKDGTEEALVGNAIISGAGLFNAPNMPDIAGIETFGGKIFHTTNWDHSFDYTGKRVGIIGVGCTGAQLMPKVAQDAGHVDVFQRSPHWVSKMPGYRDEVPEEIQWLLQHIPNYWNWHVFSVFYTLFADDGALQVLDHEWRAKGGKVNPQNDALLEAVRDGVLAEFPDDPAMASKLMPNWPPFAKRLVVDNGWFDALKRPNVSLVTEGIERVTPKGIVTADGAEHELDLIVVAGGFKAERYLWPTHYVGRNGTTLEKAWEKDGARAYLGVTVPEFPNMFIIYGPNMQARAGGLFCWLEIWARYSVQAIVQMLESGHRAMECRRDVHDAYNARLDEEQASCLWALDGHKSYYLNEHGRQGVNNPLRPSTTYSLVREVRMEDFVLD